MEKKEFAVRGIELHSLYAWVFKWIDSCLTFMQRERFNTLVLHRNDFVDLIVYPGKYFGCKKDSYDSIFERYKEIFRTLYKFTPTRRSGPYQRRAFLKRVLTIAKKRGISIYVENKELYFPEILLEFYPELVKNGKICATDPFWIEFLKEKYREFFAEFPEVDGIITAPATGESKVSITSNRCTCERCRNTSRAEWFKNVLEAMYEPIHAAGKKLVVRDFVFNPEAHKAIASVMENLPSDVVISLKNTPHDYYPTFPENPRIGNVGDHEQWLEFDAMGQYFGWGIGIANLADDYRRRMKSALEKGADGIILRTDWESLDGHTAFRTQNKVNLYAAGMLSNNVNTTNHDIYDHYLSSEGWYAGKDNREKTLEYYTSIIDRTWPLASKTMFVNSCVFSDSSLMPISYEHAFWLAEEKNSLKDWIPEKSDALAPKRERLEENLQEIDRSLKEADALYQLSLEEVVGLTAEKLSGFRDAILIQKYYVELFALVKKVLLTARYLKETEESHESEYYKGKQATLKGLLSNLDSEEEFLRHFGETTEFHPHTIYTLLDPDRVHCLKKDIEEKNLV